MKITHMSRIGEKPLSVTVGETKIRSIAANHLSLKHGTGNRRLSVYYESQKMIAIGNDAFSKRRELMPGSLSLSSIKTYNKKVVAWSVVLYARETWTPRKDVKILEAFEVWIWILEYT